MSYLYETASGQGFFIYKNQNEIILRKKEGHQFYLPVVMVRDYKSGLNDTVYNSAIYYTYINENGAIVVRSVLEYVFPFERQAGESVSYDAPKLVAFYGRLILFYMEKNTSDGEAHYRLHGILPYESQREIFNVDLRNKETQFKLVCLNERLLVSVENEKGYVLYEIASDLQVVAHGKIERLYKYDDRISERNYEEEASDEEIGIRKNANDNNEKNKMETTGGENTDTGADKEQELAMLKSSILEQQKEIDFYKSQIESAKRQYQELMQVAEQYRQEANHWSRKFT